MIAERTLDRMRHAVRAHASAPEAAQGQRRRAWDGELPLERMLGGEWVRTAEGRVFVRDEWFPPDHLHGRLALSALLDVPADVVGKLLGGEHTLVPARAGFFDIETTGMAGGSGTYVVLAGLGSFEEGAFRLRQYFLADIAEEGAMLSLLARDIASLDALVTYNGRAFDVPVVQTRMTMARVRFSGVERHVDLLHVVRRLYRHRLLSCRLAEAERFLLRVERPDDIPGWLIPSLYFDYVRAGRAAPLRGVFRHNADDVLSLVGVLASVARLLASDDLDPDDAIAAARWWERTGEEPRAMDLYGVALPWLEGGDDWQWVAQRHARLCKRAGRREDAADLWRELWRRGDPRAGLELAKHYEHRTRELAPAREVTLELLRRADGAEREALKQRLARVERKLARSVAGR